MFFNQYNLFYRLDFEIIKSQPYLGKLCFGDHQFWRFGKLYQKLSKQNLEVESQAWWCRSFCFLRKKRIFKFVHFLSASLNTTQQYYQMHSTASTLQGIPLKKEQQSQNYTQLVFKYVCLVAVLILIFCIPGFLNFRLHCQNKGYYVFSVDSISWITLGFFLIFLARYSYYKFARKYIATFVKQEYEGEEREKKIELLMKLSYDSVYYLIMTAFAYYNFRSEYWFPDMAGGCGSCTKIYSQFPNWPSDYRSHIEAFFCFQLGVHSFLLFELFTFRRKDKKFYEWCLHHTVACSLILFSMMCNQIAAGLMILIVHDASDVVMSFSRFYYSAHIPSIKQTVVQVLMAILLVFSWIYMRLVVFPFCLLSNVYINNPLPTDEWYIIKYQYMYLLIMAFLLVGMHLYWTFYLIKSVFAFIKKKENPNTFDVHKKRQK